MEGGEGGGRAVCVTVNGCRRILSGVDWRTTAGELSHKLSPPGSAPLMLVESWRGCLRPVHRDEYVCQILEDWGEEARNVSLCVMSPHSLPGARYTRRGLDTGKIYRAQRHGKVSQNKKRCLSRISTPRKEVGKEIARLVARAEVARERLAEVEELEHKVKDTTLSECASSLSLTLSEEEEWMALQEQLTEEEKEGRELEERCREIREKINTQTSDVEQTKRRNIELRTKLLQEKEKQRKLSDSERDRELSEAAAQVERLKNELKVRQKLNQLQSNKMQEISTLIAALERQEDCTV